MVWDTGPLDWESSALTNRRGFVFSLLIFNESEICGISNTERFDSKMSVQVPITFTNLRLTISCFFFVTHGIFQSLALKTLFLFCFVLLFFFLIFFLKCVKKKYFRSTWAEKFNLVLF